MELLELDGTPPRLSRPERLPSFIAADQAVHYGSTTAVVGSLGLNPTIAGWDEAAWNRVLLVPEDTPSSPGAAVHREFSDAVAQALFDPRQATLRDVSYVVAPFRDFAKDGKALLVTRNAFVAAQHNRGYVHSLAHEGTAALCSCPIAASRIGDVCLRSYEPTQSSREVTADDLPNIFVADVDPTKTRDELKRTLGGMVAQLEIGVLPHNVAYVPNRPKTPSLALRHNYSYADLPNIEQTGARFHQSEEQLRFEVRRARPKDWRAALLIRMVTYVEAYGGLTGNPAAAAEFVCAHANDQGKHYWERVGMFLQNTIPQGETHQLIVDCHSKWHAPHPIASGDMTFLEPDAAAISNIYVLESHQRRGAATLMYQEMERILEANNFDGILHLITTKDAYKDGKIISGDKRMPARDFYESEPRGFQEWPTLTGGPVWPDGTELRQLCLSRRWGPSARGRRLIMPTGQKPSLSWADGRLQYTRYIPPEGVQ